MNKTPFYNNFHAQHSWRKKRIILNIFWILFNVFVLAFITYLLLGSEWELIWYFVVMVYTSAFWILTTILFDLLIGDEFDQEIHNSR